MGRGDVFCLDIFINLDDSITKRIQLLFTTNKQYGNIIKL
jgi:hypothetical protein